jgi:hypothetical protein
MALLIHVDTRALILSFLEQAYRDVKLLREIKMDTNSDCTVAQNIDQAQFGCVKVRQLDQLLFEGTEVPSACYFDYGNIRCLIHQFDKEGCHCLNPATWIPRKIYNVFYLPRAV